MECHNMVVFVEKSPGNKLQYCLSALILQHPLIYIHIIFFVQRVQGGGPRIVPVGLE